MGANLNTEGMWLIWRGP